MSSYYTFIEGGRMIPQKIPVPIFYHLEKERTHTHHWMQIEKTRCVHDIAIMEEKVTEMGKDLANFRLRETMLKNKLQET